MFKYISEILKSFTPAQRIIALIILVCTIVIITLGPSLIKTNTSNCDELVIRLKSQEEQITELNNRVTDLNIQLLKSQKECTDDLLAKQKEIMDIIDNTIKETVENKGPKKMIKKSINSDNGMSEMIIPIPENNDEKMINKLQSLKKEVQNKFKK